MVKLTGAGGVERGKELTPARLFAFELYKEKPQITTAELDKALKEKGFEVNKATFATWLTRFKKGKGVRTYDGKPPRSVEPRMQRIPVKPGEVTLEQIIKAVGSVEALSLLFYQGVMVELERRDSAFDVLRQECLQKDELISGLKYELREVTRERNKLMSEYNETMAKLKVGTLTLDKVEHKLIPKDKK